VLDKLLAEERKRKKNNKKRSKHNVSQTSFRGHNYCVPFILNFQNGRHCHGNGQNAKKLKNGKRIIAGYSLNRN
jgi:hypothetical protein